MTETIQVSQEDYNAILSQQLRVQAIAGMLNEELSHLNLMIATLNPAKATEAVVDGVPVSVAAGNHIDHDLVLKNLRESGTLGEEMQERLEEYKKIPLMHGPDGVLARHLSPEVMRCGKGLLTVGALLQQYEEDLNTAGYSRLLLWPEGFYRNAETKEQQLLIKCPNRRLIYRIDGLPGENPTIKVFIPSLLTPPENPSEETLNTLQVRDITFPHLHEAHPSVNLMTMLKNIADHAEATLSALSVTLELPAA